MGLRPLGPRWVRRIERVTGLGLHRAVGAGGYVMWFTTVDHRHGWFDLKMYRRADAEAAEVWGLFEVDEITCWSSCRDRWPEQVEQQWRRQRMAYLGWRMNGVR